MSENLSFSGDLKVNGVSVENVDKIGNQVAYVMQDDILLATFTPVGNFLHIKQTLNEYILLRGFLVLCRIKNECYA